MTAISVPVQESAPQVGAPVFEAGAAAVAVDFGLIDSGPIRLGSVGAANNLSNIDDPTLFGVIPKLREMGFAWFSGLVAFDDNVKYGPGKWDNAALIQTFDPGLNRYTYCEATPSDRFKRFAASLSANKLGLALSVVGAMPGYQVDAIPDVRRHPPGPNIPGSMDRRSSWLQFKNVGVYSILTTENEIGHTLERAPKDTVTNSQQQALSALAVQEAIQLYLGTWQTGVGKGPGAFTSSAFVSVLVADDATSNGRGVNDTTSIIEALGAAYLSQVTVANVRLPAWQAMNDYAGRKKELHDQQGKLSGWCRGPFIVTQMSSPCLNTSLQLKFDSDYVGDGTEEVVDVPSPSEIRAASELLSEYGTGFDLPVFGIACQSYVVRSKYGLFKSSPTGGYEDTVRAIAMRWLLAMHPRRVSVSGSVQPFTSKYFDGLQGIRVLASVGGARACVLLWNDSKTPLPLGLTLLGLPTRFQGRSLITETITTDDPTVVTGVWAGEAITLAPYQVMRIYSTDPAAFDPTTRRRAMDSGIYSPTFYNATPFYGRPVGDWAYYDHVRDVAQLGRKSQGAGKINTDVTYAHVPDTFYLTVFAHRLADVGTLKITGKYTDGSSHQMKAIDLATVVNPVAISLAAGNSPSPWLDTDRVVTIEFELTGGGTGVIVECWMSANLAEAQSLL